MLEQQQAVERKRSLDRNELLVAELRRENQGFKILKELKKLFDKKLRIQTTDTPNPSADRTGDATRQGKKSNVVQK